MITAVIATHGRPALLSKTLDSLSQCEIPSSYRELLVVENGARQGAEKVVSDCAPALKAKYLHFANANKSAALNYAIENAEQDLIVFFDDDIRFDKAVLKHYEIASRDRQSGIFYGGPFNVDYEKVPEDWIVLPPSARGWELAEPKHRGKKPWFAGFNWAAFKTDIDLAGGFDPRFGPGGTSKGRGQETTMQEALLAHHVRSEYVPDALVWHYVPASRCSVEWSLQRAFENGIKDGSNLANQSRKIFGVPRWLYRKLATEFFMWMFFRLVCNDRESYLRKYNYKRTLGLVQGSRVGNSKAVPKRLP